MTSCVNQIVNQLINYEGAAGARACARGSLSCLVSTTALPVVDAFRLESEPKTQNPNPTVFCFPGQDRRLAQWPQAVVVVGRTLPVV